MTIRRLGLAVWLTALVAGSLVLAQEDSDMIQIRGAAGTIGSISLSMDNPFAVESRTISVTGTGKVSAEPDVADINVGVVTQASTAREALSANNEAMRALMDTVKERGVAPKDVQTSNINISPQYSQPPQVQQGQRPQNFQPEIYAYEVTNTVRITVRELSKLGELLDVVVSAGANRMNGISFRIEESAKLLDQCRKSAMSEAKRKAEQLAGEAGVVVGPPLSISEQGAAPPPPRPMMMYRAMAAESSVPVASGEQELSLSVQVTYELRMPK